MKIVLLGVPGSGKGTQDKLISKEYNLPQISMGDILRTVAEGEDETSEKYERLLHDKFVPNKVMVVHDASKEVPKVLETTLFGKTVRQGKATLYQCEHGSCKSPLNSEEAFQKMLEGL